MSVEIKSISVNLNSFQPELLIGVTVDYEEKNNVIVHVGGHLIAENGKKISTLNETLQNSNQELEFSSMYFQNRQFRENHFKNRDDRYRKCYFTLSAQLSPSIIQYIEELREKNKRKEVRFSASIHITKTKTTFTGQQSFVGEFIALSKKSRHASFTISQSDWIQNYASKLGIGDFLMLELKIPDALNVQKSWTKMFEKLLLNIQTMKQKIKEGDWEGVILQSRKFHENLRFKSQTTRNKLKTMYELRNGSELGFDEMYKGINSYFDFLSKFIHDKGQDDKFNANPIPKIEDAYMALNLCTGLMYLMSKKLET